MASAEDIAEIRRLINEPIDASPWTDDYISGRLDAWEGTNVGLAANLWREKASKYASLIDIQEGNSSRKMSQLHSQALSMASALDSVAENVDGTAPARVSRTRQIERM